MYRGSLIALLLLAAPPLPSPKPRRLPRKEAGHSFSALAYLTSMSIGVMAEWKAVRCGLTTLRLGYRPI